VSNKQKIVILGAAESGVGTAMLALKQGFEVFVSDKGLIKEKYKNILLEKGIDFEEGQHTESKILDAFEVVKSPGIPDKVELIKKIKAHNIPVISEIEFAGRYTNAKMICITGTNGKTTTTLLTYHIFKKAGLNVGLAGNVGKSFAWQVAENNFDYYVLELSSFQLDGMFKFKADVAILTNITPDHLDRYDYKLENYIASKFRITQNQSISDYFIYSADDTITTEALKTKKINSTQLPYSSEKKLEKGAWIEENKIVINPNNNQFTMSFEELALQGKHNLRNSMAAGVAAKLFEIRKDIIRESLSDFQNIEHRLESVAKVNGIEFINDSKATNVNSTWFALESMTTPTIWIAGGVDKGNDYAEILELVKSKVKVIVCLGIDNSPIVNAFDGIIPIVETNNIQDAVKAAYRNGKKGETVLLSPACASFDLFENYEDRGNQFKQAVREL